jgi:hypothetical protein
MNISHTATHPQSSPGAPGPGSATGEITLSDLIAILSDSWLAIAAFTLLGGLVAGAVAWLSTPIYQARVLLALAANENSGGSALSRLAGQIAPLASIGGLEATGGLNDRNVWIATLKSRQLTEQFIAKGDLLPTLFPKRWNAVEKNWKVRGGRSLQPSMEEAFRLFDEVVADWATALVAQANELIRGRVVSESQQSVDYLKRELDKTTIAELHQVIYGLIENKISQSALANVRKEYAFATVDPASKPEPGSFIRPRRLVSVLVGLLCGLALGLTYAGVKWTRAGA